MKDKGDPSMIVTEATRTTALPSGECSPVLGQGTWHMVPLEETIDIGCQQF